jgi:hypothetical protein
METTTVIDLLLFVFGSIGMAHIIVDGSIFQTRREKIKKRAETPVQPAWYRWTYEENGYHYSYFRWAKAKIVECHMCCGFWTGLLVCPFTLSHNPAKMFIAGCAASFLSMAGALIFNWLEANSVVDLPPDNR